MGTVDGDSGTPYAIHAGVTGVKATFTYIFVSESDVYRNSDYEVVKLYRERMLPFKIFYTVVGLFGVAVFTVASYLLIFSMKGREFSIVLIVISSIMMALAPFGYCGDTAYIRQTRFR